MKNPSTAKVITAVNNATCQVSLLTSNKARQKIQMIMSGALTMKTFKYDNFSRGILNLVDIPKVLLSVVAGSPKSPE
jgi:hypothetical protein